MTTPAAPQSSPSRRSVLEGAAATAVSAAALASMSAVSYAADSQVLKVGLVGCGRRGRGAADDCVKASPNVQISAVCDLFEDHLRSGIGHLKNLGPAFTATPDTCFSGFDSYKKVIATDCDVVILAAPPGFRPQHFAAAVEAGKHVMMEKPAAVDPAGVRSIIATAKIAKEKNLKVAAGTQRRHQTTYIETIQRIHDGQIGPVVSAQGYWLGDYKYYAPVHRKPEWSDMEWHCRNWNYFTWLSGDHIVEQHVHNLDILMWAIGADPISCIGVGSRAVRTGPEFGHIYDNFALTYDFPNGVTATSLCRQMTGTQNYIGEVIQGTKGTARNGLIEGQNPWKFEGKTANQYVQTHADLHDAIRNNKPLNEADQLARSTMMAVIGRMAAYTGKKVAWNWAMNDSKLDLTPPSYTMGPLPTPEVAVPGVTPLV
jgi:predicted dehydrogenase